MIEFNYETKSKVTEQDYLFATGVDLNAELKAIITNDVGDNPAPRFIFGIEEYIIDYFTTIYDWDGSIETDHQRNQLKKAVISQIQYVLRNGSIMNDSGYNSQTGQIIPRSTLEAIGVGSVPFLQMRKGGMANIRRC